MKALIIGVMAVTVAMAGVDGAFAKQKKDGANSGYCPDGRHVDDMSKCQTKK